MTHLELLQEIITTGRRASSEELRQLTMEWPALVLPYVAALESSSHSEIQDKELPMQVNVRLGNLEALYRLLGQSGLDNFYPDPRHAERSTNDTIDAFIGKFSTQDPKREAEVVEQLILNPTPDYATMLLAEDKKEDLQPDVEPEELATDVIEPSETDKKDLPTLSESLARVMIKNKNYTKALEIIQAISLNNPEKSIYFADQIRFLRKLIINQRYQNK